MTDKKLRYYLNPIPDDLLEKYSELADHSKKQTGVLRHGSAAFNALISTGLSVVGILAAIICVTAINNKRPDKHTPGSDKILSATEIAPANETAQATENAPATETAQTTETATTTEAAAHTATDAPAATSTPIPSPAATEGQTTAPNITSTPLPTQPPKESATPRGTPTVVITPEPSQAPGQPYDYPEIPRQRDYLDRPELYMAVSELGPYYYYTTYREIFINVGDKLEVPVTQTILSYIPEETNTMSYSVGDDTIINFERIDEYRPNGSKYNFYITALRPGDTRIHIYGYYDPSDYPNIDFLGEKKACVSIDYDVVIHVVESGGSKIIAS